MAFLFILVFIQGEQNFHFNYKKEEEAMGDVSFFTTGSYNCKPLMTDVIVIHNLAN